MKNTIKTILLVIVVLLPSSRLFAQNGRAPGRIRSMKIAFITDRLQLSSSQAEKFWPVYNRFEEEMKDLRMQYKIQRNKKAENNMSDEEVKHQLDNNLEFQASVVDLKKKYNVEFLKIVSPSKLVELQNAEKDFRLMLLKELRDRKEENGSQQRDEKRMPR